jgi:hypothetical protein
LTILIDHNIEGQATLLWEAFVRGGWLDLCPLRMETFAEVGLPLRTADREVWRFCQTTNRVLLTDNRNRKGSDSLDQTISEENNETALPVLTIGTTKHLIQREYRDRCATRICEIVLDLDNYRGTGRLFLP